MALPRAIIRHASGGRGTAARAAIHVTARGPPPRAAIGYARGVTRAPAPALALLAACYAPSPPSGAPCSPTQRCPEPLACIAGVCRTGEPPADGAPTGDGPPPGDAGPDAALICPTGFTKTPFGACHFVNNMPVSWLEAELDCEQRGGHLVVPSNLTEATALPIPVWIGISDRAVEGTFRTVTGSLLAFQFWGVGEPINGPPDCVAIGGMARWHVGPCEFSLPYACEYDGLPAVPSAF